MAPDPGLPTLFAELQELPPEARRRRLDALAAVEPARARELEELLGAGERDADRLETPAYAALHAPHPERALHEPELAETIGPYRRLAEIGRGGMGRVFLAEQVTETFRRRVALKVLDAPATGGDAVRRFREELRILAALEHPGIARFLDGGRSPEGVWFLALEFVEGVDLFTAARALGVDERVELFARVLDAVAYAHERQIVHRDLKPGNIFVARDGAPKLLDFGISKLLDAEAGAELPPTRTELRAFTPQYASPEQFRGEPAHPASDIYSAGAVLYELLSGVRPHRARSNAPLEIERAVLHDDPEPPSTAARRAAPEERDGDTTATASLASARWRRSGSVRDLDAICLKALRKSAAERYSSAAEFAEDLRRFLRREPVLARKGGRRYRIGRFASRHRRALAATFALLAVVAATLALTRLAGRSGDTPAARSVPQPFPFSATLTPPIEELQRQFDREPGNLEVGAALAISLNRDNRAREAALIVARLRQLPGSEADPLIDYVEAIVANELGEPQRALLLHTRALERAEATGRGELVGQIRASRGRLLSTLGRRAEGTREMEAARAEFEAAGDPASLARVLNDLAIDAVQTNELDRAEALFEGALAATRAASPTNSGATFLGNLATLARYRGHPEIAEQRFLETVAIFRELGRPAREALHLSGLASALFELGRTEEALAAIAESVRLATENGADQLPEHLYAQALLRLDTGEAGAIEGAVAEIEEITRRSGSPLGLALADHLRGRASLERGDFAEGFARLEESRRFHAESGSLDDAAWIELEIAEARLRAGELDAARALAESLAEPLRGRGENARLFRAELLLSRTEARAGRPGAARARLEPLRAVGESTASVDLALAYRAAAADLERAAGRGAEARAELERAIALADRAGRRPLAAQLRRELEGVANAAEATASGAEERRRLAPGSSASAEPATRSE